MAGGVLVFLHVADIHFRRWSGDKWDIEEDVRNELIQDAERMSGEFPDPSGVLVGGDIAFSGATTEYAHAKDFLQKLSGRIGSAGDRVWCVPGNHDVDRDYVEKTLVLKDARKQFRQTEPPHLDERIRQYMQNAQSSELLLRPITEYNKFAAAFRCAVSAAEPVWHQDFPLNDGSILRLSGLNSTIISDKSDDDSKKVLLGRFQIPLSGPDVTHICMCHHPPDWWLDDGGVEQTLTARARVHLFAHKHRQWLHTINNTVRLSAGAMHPSRTEIDWSPRFNWLLISVNVIGACRRLQVDVYPRIWDGNDGRFIADRNTCNGEIYQSIQLELDPRASDTRISLSPKPSEGEIRAQVDESVVQSETTGVAMMDPVRTLTYRFFSLAHVVRLDIARDLKLLKDEDEGLQDYELFRRILHRAAQGNLMAELWDKVEAHHEGKCGTNPFRK
jgi:hypothetical protein